jgi:pilus assembly protein CpaD
LLVAHGAPVTVGAVPSGMVRVVVSRSRASVPGCPNWSVQSQPNYDNRTMSNFGCGVNSNLAAMVANPDDLVFGREGPSAVDGKTGAKAITMYRDWPLTGVMEGQQKRPLKDVNTKKGD